MVDNKPRHIDVTVFYTHIHTHAHTHTQNNYIVETAHQCTYTPTHTITLYIHHFSHMKPYHAPASHLNDFISDYENNNTISSQKTNSQTQKASHVTRIKFEKQTTMHSSKGKYKSKTTQIRSAI